MLNWVISSFIYRKLNSKEIKREQEKFDKDKQFLISTLDDNFKNLFSISQYVSAKIKDQFKGYSNLNTDEVVKEIIDNQWLKILLIANKYKEYGLDKIIINSLILKTKSDSEEISVKADLLLDDMNYFNQHAKKNDVYYNNDEIISHHFILDSLYKNLSNSKNSQVENFFNEDLLNSEIEKEKDLLKRLKSFSFQKQLLIKERELEKKKRRD